MIDARPRCIVLCALSFDGKISPGTGVSSRLFGSIIPNYLTKKRMELREAADAVMVGSNTILADNPSLITPKTQNTIRLIADSRGRTRANHKVLSDNFLSIFLVTESTPTSFKKDILSRKNKQTLICGKNKIDYTRAMKLLYDIGVRKIMIEGGGQLIYQLLSEKLIDEIRLVYMPKFIAKDNAPSIVSGPKSLFEDLNLKIKQHKTIKNFIYLECGVDYL